MKKFLIVVLALMFAFSMFTGCAASAPGPEDTSQTADDQTPSGPPADDNVVETAAMNYFANLPDGNNAIKSPDFFAKIDAGEDMVILDIRQAPDYEAGHLQNAVSVPFGKAVADNLEMIPDDVPVYVYCYTGQTASQTTALLNAAGKTAKNVQSGFNNGISKTEGYEQYVTTDPVPALSGEYPVDPAIKAAIVKYYENVDAAIGTDFQNLNISAANAKAILDSGDDSYFFLDVRQAADYEAGHIPTAMNIPFKPGMEQSFSQLPEDKTIIVNCYTGQTASQVVGILRLLGFEAYNLSGGMGAADPKAGWLGEGFEVVTD